MLKDNKCLIGSPCKHCDPSVCLFYKHSYSRDNDQDEKENKKENERLRMYAPRTCGISGTRRTRDC